MLVLRRAASCRCRWKREEFTVILTLFFRFSLFSFSLCCNFRSYLFRPRFIITVFGQFYTCHNGLELFVINLHKIKKQDFKSSSLNCTWEFCWPYFQCTLLVPSCPSAFKTALILGVIDSTRSWEHSSKILVYIDMTASRLLAAKPTTSQRSSVGLRSGDCRSNLNPVNSLKENSVRWLVLCDPAGSSHQKMCPLWS